MTQTFKSEAERNDALAKEVNSPAKKKRTMQFAKHEDEGDILEKSVITTIEDLRRGKSITRLAFAEDPTLSNKYQSLYKPKVNLIPDYILKRLSLRDDLVAAIANARANQVSAFGRLLQDRFSTGFRIEPHKGVMENATPTQKHELMTRIAKVSGLVNTCGSTEGVAWDDSLSLASFLYQQARNAVVFGRFATEISYTTSLDGKKEFHSFRPVDVGTIFQCAPQPDALDTVRKNALKLLQDLNHEKLRPEKFENDEYAWVQVIQGFPRQAFTPEDLIVHDVYPCTDIEYGGYPITPIDTAIDAIITHMNITQHNKLYFQAGRAARGMIVIKSEDVNQDIVAQIKQHFQASINSVQNSWRVPIFGIGTEEDISWEPLEAQGGRDMEFQYLADSNARVILSAFQMSPEELPGYAHLSKGTNNQALCLDLSSTVINEFGTQTVGDILGELPEKMLKVWTGETWARARAFRTGIRQRAVTTLWNGSSLLTSPEHRFRAIGPAGIPVWKHQSELKVGDSVLVNRKPVIGTGTVPEFRGKKLTPELMEVLGWLTGDGNFNIRYNKNTKNMKASELTWFYHHEKEVEIWKRHFEILTNFGLPALNKSRAVSEEEKKSMKERYGFKSIANTRLTNKLSCADFTRWLLSLGFKSSTEGKVIPSFVSVLPIEYRQAFLRGLFSADGSKTAVNGARIVIHDNNLRQQTRSLLLGLGIRTQFSEGKNKQDIDCQHRKMIAGSTTLSIKDKLKFFELVGFLQPHKQPDLAMLAASERKWERIPGEVTTALLGPYKKALRIFDPNINRVLADGCSQSVLEKLAAQVGIILPDWVSDYYLEEVVEVRLTNESVEMADLEVYDELHAFVVDGVIVHNSESNNEYKLEAARDVGIRPLLTQFQDFLNEKILPLMDPLVARICTLKLYGLDVDTKEKESTQIQAEMPIHGEYDEIRTKVEKAPIGKEWAGQFPLNPGMQGLIDKYFTVAEIKKHFFGREPAKDGSEEYFRDPFWFNFQQLKLQAGQMQQQAEAQKQQAQAAAQPPPGEDGGGNKEDGDKPQGELATGIDQLEQTMGKSEADLPPAKRRLLAQHKATVKSIMDSWEKEAESALREVMSVAKPKKA